MGLKGLGVSFPAPYPYSSLLRRHVPAARMKFSMWFVSGSNTTVSVGGKLEIASTINSEFGSNTEGNIRTHPPTSAL